jgi:putative zinc finger/helix-turn-helix YgiT family protein
MTTLEKELKMTTPILCDYCGEGHMATESYSETFRNGRATLMVKGLEHMRCEACDSTMTSAQQFQYNAQLIKAAEKKSPAYISPATLREFREKYDLSQRAASKLVGAGEGAFGKYESGSNLATPTAKLIRVALAFPEVARMLAEEEGMEIISLSGEDEWKPGTFVYRTTLTRHASISQNDDVFLKGTHFSDPSVWQKPNLLAANA